MAFKGFKMGNMQMVLSERVLTRYRGVVIFKGFNS